MSHKKRSSKHDEFEPIPDKLSDNDADVEEEEKNVLLPSKPQDLPPSVADSYQNNASLSMQPRQSRNKAVDEFDANADYHNAVNADSDGPHSDGNSDGKQDGESLDLSHSTVLLCRITLFMYLFVIILIYDNFPQSDTSNVDTHYNGWFRFFLWIDILSCLLGMAGNFLTKPRWLYICWVSLTISMVLVGIIVVVYTADRGTLDTDHGVGKEAHQRCTEWREHDTDFENTYTLDECLRLMKTQLTWTVGLLYVIFAVMGGIGIHIIMHCEKYMEKYYVDDYDDAMEDDLLSDLSSNEYQGDLDDFMGDEYGISMDNKKNR